MRMAKVDMLGRSDFSHLQISLTKRLRDTGSGSGSLLAATQAGLRAWREAIDL